MANMDFYVSMIIGSPPLSELRERYVRGIIRAVSKNQKYECNGETPKLDEIYEKMVSFKVLSDQAKSRHQIETIIRSIVAK